MLNVPRKRVGPGGERDRAEDLTSRARHRRTIPCSSSLGASNRGTNANSVSFQTQNSEAAPGNSPNGRNAEPSHATTFRARRWPTAANEPLSTTKPPNSMLAV
jgi:hypothetical protein